VLSFATPNCGFGEEVDAITSFGAWSVFKDDVACWAASSAEEVNIDSDTINEEDLVMYVSFFYRQPVPEISFLGGNTLGDSAIATVGAVQADFFSDEDGSYFAVDSERTLLFAMLEAQQVDLSSRVSTKPMVAFSLEGFKEAYNSLARMCEFKPADFADGDVT
jgi:hypothetical protein